jgi:hypothetical protein
MTPEGRVKIQIAKILQFSELIFKRKIVFWYNASTGIYDARKKIYRKNNSPYAMTGVSDILGVIEGGIFLAIEVKAKRGRTTPAQREYLAKINEMGGIAMIANDPSQFVIDLKKRISALLT